MECLLKVETSQFSPRTIRKKKINKQCRLKKLSRVTRIKFISSKKKQKKQKKQMLIDIQREKKLQLKKRMEFR